MKFCWQATLKKYGVFNFVASLIIKAHECHLFISLFIMSLFCDILRKYLSIQFPFGHLTPGGSVAAVCFTEARFKGISSLKRKW